MAEHLLLAAWCAAGVVLGLSAHRETPRAHLGTAGRAAAGPLPQCSWAWKSAVGLNDGVWFINIQNRDGLDEL